MRASTSHAATWVRSISHSIIDSWNGCFLPALSIVLPPPAFPRALPSTTQVGRPSIRSTWRMSSLYLAGARLVQRSSTSVMWESASNTARCSAASEARVVMNHSSYGAETAMGLRLGAETLGLTPFFDGTPLEHNCFPGRPRGTPMLDSLRRRLSRPGRQGGGPWIGSTPGRPGTRGRMDRDPRRPAAGLRHVADQRRGDHGASIRRKVAACHRGRIGSRPGTGPPRCGRGAPAPCLRRLRGGLPDDPRSPPRRRRIHVVALWWHDDRPNLGSDVATATAREDHPEGVAHAASGGPR